ncbi:hypothetical protein ACFY7C_11960 [Streptomyces sp. NPDC012769]|uniref:hypothetical protein n=1 Tax=Streptomyces sp. NPDC012769 TaxID=3364848 RepID=UPI00369C788C
MTDTSSEQKLANDAKAALLTAVKEAANKGLGERALQLAQAYATIAVVDIAPDDSGSIRTIGGQLGGRR